MISIVVFSLFAISSVLGGTAPVLTGKIVGGQTVTIDKYPYQVSVVKYGDFHFCGATILSEYTVVTAAHCVPTGDPNNIGIRVGSSISGEGGQLIEVKSIKVHPQYDAPTYKNDIAVMTLKSKIVMNAGVAKIGLCSTPPAVGAVATVTGWGVLREGLTEAALKLQQVDLNVIGNSDCNNKYGSGRIPGDLMVCANAPNKDACQGDSGGPMICNGCLAGIVSWGIGCARAQYPGVFTNVANYRTWIEGYVTK